MAEFYAVIMAGGTGTRVGGERPKQFLELEGQTVLTYTTAKFAAFSGFSGILVTTPAEWEAETARLTAAAFPERNDIFIVPGGATRNDTLMNAIDFIEEKFSLDDETVVVTHDCARPFVTEEIIRANLEAGQAFDASTTAVPATDTIMESKDGRLVSSVPDRAHMYQVQTPQTFRAKMLREQYRSLSDSEREILTDACKIMHLNGTPVHIIPGDPANFKITYPSDLARAGIRQQEGK